MGQFNQNHSHIRFTEWFFEDWNCCHYHWRRRHYEHCRWCHTFVAIFKSQCEYLTVFYRWLEKQERCRFCINGVSRKKDCCKWLFSGLSHGSILAELNFVVISYLNALFALQVKTTFKPKKAQKKHKHIYLFSLSETFYYTNTNW